MAIKYIKYQNFPFKARKNKQKLEFLVRKNTNWHLAYELGIIKFQYFFYILTFGILDFDIQTWRPFCMHTCPVLPETASTSASASASNLRDTSRHLHVTSRHPSSHQHSLQRSRKFSFHKVRVFI
jgi:hypothetical protein